MNTVTYPVLPAGGYYVYGVYDVFKTIPYYEYHLVKVEKDISYNEIKPLHDTDKDSLLVFENKEKALEWADNNKGTYLADETPIYRCMFSKIAHLIKTKLNEG